MNRYRVWVSGQKAATFEIMERETSFAARMSMANKYGLKTYDCIASRIFDDEMEAAIKEINNPAKSYVSEGLGENIDFCPSDNN